ncbi:unnamed protein product [Brassicogethes aeneus]|uniref:Phorbol-ester/DAG-type domain-containing protein n=1 Tax=Brassicogethes aeneus TaxID=1431903 RepID=A0A9P0BB41_BRAAE|nr:unnamed protein product [Brassicogethes aeneus]
MDPNLYSHRHGGLTLLELIDCLEERDVTGDNIYVTPPQDGEDTDVDSDLSDDKHFGNISHLGPAMLRVESEFVPEIPNEEADEYESDDIPLATLVPNATANLLKNSRPSTSKKRKMDIWTQQEPDFQINQPNSADGSLPLGNESTVKPCVQCKVVARAGLICAICGTVTHTSCAKHSKRCCGLILGENEEVIEEISDVSAVNFNLLKMLVTELRRSNKLRSEKVVFLETELTKKDDKIAHLSNVSKTPSHEEGRNPVSTYAGITATNNNVNVTVRKSATEIVGSAHKEPKQCKEKLLIHGPTVINYAIIPVGQLSEEAAQARNKHFRQYRQNFSRKFTRQQCNRDVLNRLLLSSDPFLSASRPKIKKKSKSFSKECLKLFVPENTFYGRPTEEKDEKEDDNKEE